MAGSSEELQADKCTTEGLKEEGHLPLGEMADKGSTTMRSTQPGTKRLVITLTVLLSFVLGLPFLWKSVEIYRSPLPFEDVEFLRKDVELRPLTFPCHFQAVFINFDPSSVTDLSPRELHDFIIDRMSKLASKFPLGGTCGNNFTLSITVESADKRCTQLFSLSSSHYHAEEACFYRCGTWDAVDFDADDEDVDESLESFLGGRCSNLGSSVYNVMVVMNEHDKKQTRAVVGKYRHAWIRGPDLKLLIMAETVAELFVRLFMNGGRDDALIHGESMPVGANGITVLSFNLLNSDPRDWIFDWDFENVEDTLLIHLIHALEPIAKIFVESQVLYYTPKASYSSWDKHLGSHVFSIKDLPFFVNSNEWHLDTSTATAVQSKILQFVVYIPSAKEYPLLLRLPNGEISSTNSFISPMWGGVIVWNPPGLYADSESEVPQRKTIMLQDLIQIFEVFMGQFRQLFGLRSDELFVGELGTWNFLASEMGFTKWELDALSRQFTCINLLSTATALGSLSRLVQSLPRMIIPEDIGKQVKFSLEAAKLARNNASCGNCHASALSSRQARTLAEDAFSHPSAMSVSYYSFEHCFAVYSPFFLPVSLHVVLAVLRECRRYRKEKARYSLWKAESK